MKKTWIKIKRGLLTPEHRETLGVRVWLYMYMIDRANWETGTIYGWKDKDEADDFGMPWRTLQQQRQQLERDGYITCEQQPYHQNVIIHNWTNPREYSGEQYNPTSGGTENDVSTDESTQSHVQGGTGQGTNQGVSKPSTPTYDSHITSQESEESTSSIDIPALIANATGMVTFPPSEMERIEQVHALVDAYGRESVESALSGAFKLWIGQKRRDGRGHYRRTNFGWVDWAQEKLAGGAILDNEDTLKDKLEREGYEHHSAT